MCSVSFPRAVDEGRAFGPEFGSSVKTRSRIASA
jgi:hypothetical protein